MKSTGRTAGLESGRGPCTYFADAVTKRTADSRMREERLVERFLNSPMDDSR